MDTSRAPSRHSQVMAVARWVARHPDRGQEGRMAMALALNPVRGRRLMEVHSGLADKTVLKLAPWVKDDIAGLLRCAQEGTEGPEYGDDARLTRWSLDFGQESTSKPLAVSSSITAHTSAPTEQVESGDQVTGGFLTEARDTVLDPALDTWTTAQAGTAGWVLACLVAAGRFGGWVDGRLAVTGQDVQGATGWSTRTAARTLRRLEDAGLGQRYRGGIALHTALWEASASLASDVRAQARRARYELEKVDYADPRLKYQRRAFMRACTEHDPMGDPAEWQARWDRVLDGRQAARRSFVEWAEARCDLPPPAILSA